MNSASTPASALQGTPDSKTLFRDLSNSWARGVAIVTTTDSAGKRFGLTMRAVTPVSSEPLRFLVCIGEMSRSLVAMLESKKFCINYLQQSQSSLADHFASRVEDKFAGVAWHATASGALAIDGAIASVECDVDSTIPSGDHRIVLGNVTAAHIARGAPLIIFGGSYRSLSIEDPGR